jgi:hypothetical protein
LRIILTDVLHQAWVRPFSVQSNFAREHAAIVAMAASDGFITTRIAAGVYARHWHITLKGLQHLKVLTGETSDE